MIKDFKSTNKPEKMNDLEKAIKKMDFQYFGTAQHKISVEEFLKKDDALLLDVRSDQERETVSFGLKYHCPVLEIPVHKIPARKSEIPYDKFIGVFCSSSVRCVIIFTYLKSLGYENVRMLPGGYTALLAELMPGKVLKKVNSSDEK